MIYRFKFLPAALLALYFLPAYLSAEIPAYRDFKSYYKDDPVRKMGCIDRNDLKLYELTEYFKEYGRNITKIDNKHFVQRCCEVSQLGQQNCHEDFFSYVDGNTLTLAAAQYGSLEALKYFIVTRGFKIDNHIHRHPGLERYDIAGRSELTHAMINHDLEMVKFLLGKEKDANNPDGNTILYSNPKRKLPHPDADLHLKIDAKYYVDQLRANKEWLAAGPGHRTNFEILKLVEEVYNDKNTPEHEYNLKKSIYEKKMFDLFHPEEYQEVSALEKRLFDTSFFTRPTNNIITQNFVREKDNTRYFAINGTAVKINQLRAEIAVLPNHGVVLTHNDVYNYLKDLSNRS